MNDFFDGTILESFWTCYVPHQLPQAMKAYISIYLFTIFLSLVPATLRSQDSVQYRKLYLHTDREQYFLGDTIWYKGYYLDGQSHKFVPGLITMYVDLINESGESVVDQVLAIDNGAADGAPAGRKSGCTGHTRRPVCPPDADGGIRFSGDFSKANERQKNKVDFPDALILNCAKQFANDHSVVLAGFFTFDKAAQRLPGALAP